MSLVWIIVIAVVIVAVLYVVVHRLLINRATIMLRRQAQQTTDQAVNAVISDLLGNSLNLSSEIVADVWGKGVLAFEYSIDCQKARLDLSMNQKFNRKQIEDQLNQYAQQEDIRTLPNAKRTFVVSDWWTYEGRLHIDVAYILNEATNEYVADLKRLDGHSK
ncbi:hypothetical protein [Limosilactobacillus frumenti]|nr:hypothetical protein [Limosilactobacillus frumenti]MBA2914077.1 hypothetical protein [Limosilactobacillus frumenti]QFG72420.1 hypothetical protein LF145_03295 [Limosilactobacillus frumenti]